MFAWIFCAGINLRDDVFTQTRGLREENNISNGFRWGELVLRTAERVAASPAMTRWSDPNTPHQIAQAPSPTPKNPTNAP